MSHESCHHATYHLSCPDYDALVMRSAGRCELCGSSDRALVIDHDHHLGYAAVRGLLCHRCNSAMGRIDGGHWPTTPVVQRYLDRAWHATTTPLSDEVPRRSARGITPVRTVRTDTQLWIAAQEVAAQRRESVADVLRRALVDYCEAAGREV